MRRKKLCDLQFECGWNYIIGCKGPTYNCSIDDDPCPNNLVSCRYDALERLVALAERNRPRTPMQREQS